jgi:Flp pilus assembly protein TadD
MDLAFRKYGVVPGYHRIGSLPGAGDRRRDGPQLRRNPTHVPILIRLAQIERSEGDLRGAQEHLQQALKGDASKVEVRLELGLVLSDLGDIAGAEEQNKEVLRLDPNQPDALYNLGAICANRGDVVQARRFWEEAVRADGSSDSGKKSRIALDRLRTGR